MATAQTAGFELSVSARDDGTLEAVYISLRGDPVSKTVEVLQDILMADYNKKGQLVGIEILAPVRIAELAKLVDKHQRSPFRRFVKQAAPPDLVHS